MTPAKRAGLRERWTNASDRRRLWNIEWLREMAGYVLGLLDDCDRLERTVELQRAVIAENDVDAKRLEACINIIPSRPVALDAVDRLRIALTSERETVEWLTEGRRQLIKDRDEAREAVVAIWRSSSECRAQFPELKDEIASWDTEDAQAHGAEQE